MRDHWSVSPPRLSTVLARGLPLACGVLACHARRPAAATRAEAPPLAQAVCFAGPSLELNSTTGAERPDAAAGVAGPWLRLEWYEAPPAAPGAEPAPRPARQVWRLPPAVRHTPSDTVGFRGAVWWRPSADSVVYKEERTFPATTWYLARAGADLRGQGVIVSDLAGRVERWPVWLVRVPCARVPHGRAL